MSEPISRTGFEVAIIGMAGRFPGANDIPSFWNNLKNGVESITFFSDDELRASGVPEELVNNPSYVKADGWLQDKELFDAYFFGYPPKEAELLEPQVRISLESAYHALEDAGYNPDTYAGQIGLYAGASLNFEWKALSSFSDKGKDLGGLSAIQVVEKDFLSTQISYKLNLTGPSISIYTACSTSLVAIHMACRALIGGECSMALAGGSSIVSTHKGGYLYAEGLILSPDGHCRAFDADAKGTVNGEGTGMILLKPLEDAVRDGDHIYAIINSSAINNDGFLKVGFTAPSVEGQAQAIRAALDMSEIDPETIGYIEAHGTGTELGDPIEVEALKLAFNTEKKGFCKIGSVKTNIGHLDSAAGVAGLIKTAMALKNKKIPPSINFEKPNPKINFENSPFTVNSTLYEWQPLNGPRRAGISSFGIGGTNAHVIMEEAPVRGNSSLPKDWNLLTFSAKSKNSLENFTRNLSDFFSEDKDINMTDASYTLQMGRRPMEFRRIAVVTDAENAAFALSSETSDKIRTYRVKQDNSSIIFMFPGQGAQYINMAKELYDAELFFREVLDSCFEILEAEMGFDIVKVIFTNNTEELLINQTQYSQPLLFAIEYSLARLLLHLNISPAAMIGHSIGEYVAACLAGVFSLEDAFKIICYRAQLMQSVAPGGMLSVALGEKELIPLLVDNLSVAAHNSSSLSVVAGDNMAIKKLNEKLKGRDIKTTPLHTSHAFHSFMMEGILEKFKGFLQNFKFNKPEKQYISNVTGTWILEEEATSPEYYCRHIRSTVRMKEGLDVLLSQFPHSIFLEIGPGKAMTTFLKQHKGKTAGVQSLNMLRHSNEKVNDFAYFLDKIGQIWLFGGKVDWSQLHKKDTRHRLSLPLYSFDKQRLWFDENLEKVKDKYFQKKADPNFRLPVTEWLYIPSWKRAVGTSPVAENFSGKTCIVFYNNTAWENKLLTFLNTKSSTLITAIAEENYRQVSSSDFIFSRNENGHYLKIFESLKSAESVPECIVFSCQQDNNEEQGLLIHSSFYHVLNLIQAFIQCYRNREVVINIITPEIHDVVGSEVTDHSRSVLISLSKVVSQEFPSIDLRIIDIDRSTFRSFSSDPFLNGFTNDLLYKSNAKLIAYRNNKRWVQTFERISDTSITSQSKKLKEEGIYFITGGFGHVGLTLADQISKIVKAKFILTGRREFPNRNEWSRYLQPNENNEWAKKINQIISIESRGSLVFTETADVSDEKRMQQLFDNIEAVHGKINGVIHAAGDISGESSFCKIEDITEEICQQQFLPKAQGLLVLDKILDGKEVDFCLCISSLSSIVGGLGFLPYSAANIFMDSFAAKSFVNGSTKWISLNWDGWLKEGENNKGAHTKLDITPEEGQQVFQKILGYENFPQIIISTSDLTSRVEEWVLRKRTMLSETNSSNAIFFERPELTSAYVEPKTSTEKLLTEIVKNFLGYDKIGINDDYFDLGGNSLQAFNIITKIHKEFGVNIKLTSFFEKPTIHEIARNIDDSGDKSSYRSIPKAVIKEKYKLSSAQFRMFFLQLMDKSNIAYNMPNPILLDSAYTAKQIEKALKKIISRHDTLRTSFEMYEEEPYFKVHSEIDFDLPVLVADEEEVTSIVQGLIKPFDLSKFPLLRAYLIRRNTSYNLLFLDMHHIISDGVSQNILVSELMAILEKGNLVEINHQYKDFSEWQISKEHNALIKQQENYWIETFSGVLPVLDLPLDFTRPPYQQFTGKMVSFQLNKEETEFIKSLGQQENSTLFMVLVSIYGILLSSLTDQEDIIIGCPVAGRNHADLQYIIGMFVNTLPVRTYPHKNKNFKKYLAEVREQSLKVFENQDYQFEDLVKVIYKKRDPSRNPVFDAAFNLMDLEGNQHFKKESSITKPGIHTETKAIFDITLTAKQENDLLVFDFEYCTKLFKESTIDRFINYFKKIVSFLKNKPDTLLSEINILSDYYLELLNVFSHGRKTQIKGVQILHQLFEQQCIVSSEKIAIVDEFRKLTYKQLNEKSNVIAHYLRSENVHRGDIVAILLDRSCEMITAILAILKAGATYLPIDPKNPSERINYFLNDSKCRYLITDKPIESNGIFNVIEPADISSVPGQEKNLSNINLPQDAAYIIYTSGTTGNPKGTVVEHQSVVNLCAWHNDFYSITPLDRSTQYAGPGFDAVVWEIFPYLLKGASIHIVPDDARLDMMRLNSFFEHNNISISFLPTQVAEQFLLMENRSLTRLLTGGDKLFQYHEKSYKVYNNYGPTENTVVSTAVEVDRSYSNIPIGKPIDNTQLFIANPTTFKIQPIGVAGEIFVGGSSLARGYYLREELTIEKFIYPEFNNFKRVYRTGDLGRWTAEGNVEFLGRTDHQVKIRGFRIELREIESYFLKNEAIKEVVVLARQIEQGDKFLVAYIVLNNTVPAKNIKEYLLSILPEYMVPAYIITLEQFPVTANGKIDRNALPMPELMDEAEYAAPENKLQEDLVLLWSEVLNIEAKAIGIDSNFFQIGGHSLKATILIAKIRKRFNIDFPLKEVFKNPTVRLFAVYISSANDIGYEEIKSAPLLPHYLQSSAQQRLFFLNLFDNISTAYSMPNIISVKGAFDSKRVEDAVLKLIERHEVLRTSFHLIEGKPVQVIHPQVDFKVVEIPISNNPDEKEIKQIIDNFIRPFDLSKAPLLRTEYAKIGEAEHLLFFDIHHIIGDGTSMNVLTEDFTKFYNGELIEPLRIQYKDFSEWHNHFLSGWPVQQQELYWKNQFSKSIPKLQLPLDFPRPEVFTFQGTTFRFSIDKLIIKDLKNLSLSHGATLYMGLLATFNILLHKYSGQEDILIGTFVAGRKHHEELQKILGFFVNTLAIRNYPSKEKSFKQFLSEVRDHCIVAFENQDVQFEKLIEDLNIERESSRNPLFDVGFVLQNAQQGKLFEDLGKNEITFEGYEDYENQTALFDLDVEAFEAENENMQVGFRYCTSLFRESTIVQMSEHWIQIIKNVIENSDALIKEIEIIQKPVEYGVAELLENSLLRNNTNAALIYKDVKLQAEELELKSGQVAGYLQIKRTPSSNDTVGVLMDNPLLGAIAALGIWKANSAFVPLNPNHSLEKLKDVIEAENISTVLTEASLLGLANKLQWECTAYKNMLCLDSSDCQFFVKQRHLDLESEKQVYEYFGEIAEDEIVGGGWHSSYTGLPLTKLEMDEYGENILSKLQPYLTKHTNVLELGCASGISMYRIAPQVNFYMGTDFSRVIIEKNKNRIKEENIDNIGLACIAAHELNTIQGTYDLIIINSVIQDFNEHNYLRLVIKSCIEKLNANGLLFIGDVMDQDKKEDLIKELKEFKRTNKGKNYKTKVEWEQELFISRSFFQDLAQELEGIISIDFSEKIYTIENELTKYRYDTLFCINKKAKSLSTQPKNKTQDDIRVLTQLNYKYSDTVSSRNLIAAIIFSFDQPGGKKRITVSGQEYLRAYYNWIEMVSFLPEGSLLLNNNFLIEEVPGHLLKAFASNIHILLDHHLEDKNTEYLDAFKKHINVIEIHQENFNKLLIGNSALIDNFPRLHTIVLNDDVHFKQRNILLEEYKGSINIKNNLSGIFDFKQKVNLKSQKYWQAFLQEGLVRLDLPLDFPRPTVFNGDCQLEEFKINETLLTQVRAFSLANNITINDLLLSTLSILLGKYGATEEVIVGIPVNSKANTADSKNVEERFIPLRTFPAGEKSFLEFVLDVKQQHIITIENQDFQISDLIKISGIPTDDSRNPLFDVSFSGEEDETISTKKIVVTDIEIYFRDNDDISVQLHYATSLFKKETISKISHHWKYLLKEFMENYHSLISCVGLLSMEERKEVVNEMKKNVYPFNKDLTYKDYFESQVLNNREKIAAIHQNTKITYGDLNIYSNKIAHFLLQNKVSRSSIIVLYLNRGITLLATMLSTFKSGAAFMAVDIDHPQSRIFSIIDDCSPLVIITESRYEAEVIQYKQERGSRCQVLVLSDIFDLPPTMDTFSIENPNVQTQSDDLAYIIFTSGTTGKPKGVKLHQLGLINHLWGNINMLKIIDKDVIAQTASMGFDISIWQCLVMPFIGGLTCIVNKHDMLDPDNLLRIVEKNNVTILQLVPSLLNELIKFVKVEEGYLLKSLRWVIPTGEAINVNIADAWYETFPGIPLVNAYGPAEASDDISLYVIEKEKLSSIRSIPIGAPLPNLHIYILDQYQNLCPQGVKGEICVAGYGVGKGYLNDEAKTSTSFIANPFANWIEDENYKVIYRTGDIGYYNEEGILEFAGRRDHQVKIRGSRIELGEIESRLLSHEAISAAVVLDHSYPNHEKFLCAYIVCDKEIDIDALKTYISKDLPEYMIPPYFMKVSLIPLTLNGKVDRKALPIPEITIHANEIEKPENPLEKKLAEIWSEVLNLNLSNVGVNSDFFDMGGHSLKATVLLANVHKELHVKIPLSEIFKEPTIRALAAYISKAEREKFLSIPTVSNKENYQLSSAQKRLFILQQMFKGYVNYNETHFIDLEGQLEVDRLLHAFKKLIQRHESLRTSFRFINGNPVQIIHDEVDFKLEFFNGSENEVYDFIKDFVRPFNLEEAPLFRVAVINNDSGQRILMDMHHIIGDGSSDIIIQRELQNLYNGKNLPPLTLQYKDFAEWQNSTDYLALIRRQEHYWLEVLAGELPILNLPNDFKRPDTMSPEGAKVAFVLDEKITQSIRAVASKYDATVSMAFITLFKTLLAKLSGQDEVIIGFALQGRNHPDLQNVIGMFINTLPLRTTIQENETFDSLLMQVKTTTLGVYENQDFPFELLVDKLSLKRNTQRNPIFDVVLNFLNGSDFPVDVQHLSDYTKGATLIHEESKSKFDLHLGIVELEKKIFAQVEYCTKLFKPSSIDKVVEYFFKIIVDVTRNENIFISNIILQEELPTIVSEEFADLIDLDF